MYTDKKNILQLVALLEAHGITKVVLCPGSRNTPIVHTLSNHPNFTCYPVTDERSAGYFAIGLALNGGKPAAVCCTSGTALLNLHPAVAEAFLSKCSSGHYFCRPSRCLDRTNGRTDCTTTRRISDAGQEVGKPSGDSYGRR